MCVGELQRFAISKQTASMAIHAIQDLSEVSKKSTLVCWGVALMIPSTLRF